MTTCGDNKRIITQNVLLKRKTFQKYCSRVAFLSAFLPFFLPSVSSILPSVLLSFLRSFLSPSLSIFLLVSLSLLSLPHFLLFFPSFFFLSIFFRYLFHFLSYSLLFFISLIIHCSSRSTTQLSSFSVFLDLVWLENGENGFVRTFCWLSLATISMFTLIGSIRYRQEVGRSTQVIQSPCSHF